jgi:ribose transport system ATP-binding protein
VEGLAPVMSQQTDALLRLSRISKKFPGVQALDSIDLEIGRGEVHALLGENGAGKSTLVKVVAGVYPSDGGTLYFEGRERAFDSPGEAAAAGIAVIHQETSLIPTLTVIENVFLGIERLSFLNVIDDRSTRREYDAVCRRFSFRLPPDRQARSLSVAEQKMTEILKAMVRNASFLIMDEPTDALSDAEIEHLFRIIRDLKQRGITVLYITHYLDEVFVISDRITVLRDGKKVDTRPTAELDRNAVVKLMVGQEVTDEAAARPAARRGPEALRAEGLSRGGAVVDASFTAYQGEILGITGVLGSGKTELARLLFGADRPDSGAVSVSGTARKIGSPVDAVGLGIGMLPEDRKRDGLILRHEVYKNVTIAALARFSGWLVMSRGRELAAVNRVVQDLSIRIRGPGQAVRDLSGGNQQKVVIAKWLVADKKVLIMDEPTRGIDVGSKAEIHRIMRRLADAGACIIFISAEVPEIVRVSDRILVMQGGRIVAECPRGTSQEEVVHVMLKGSLE